MPGFMLGTHALLSNMKVKKGVDGRDKPGHDGNRVNHDGQGKIKQRIELNRTYIQGTVANSRRG